jgi:hypothetical protein
MTRPAPIPRLLAALALAAIAPLTACRTTVGGYLEDRGNDTLDIFPFSAASGPGLYFGARVTELFGTALGYESTRRHGWRRANWLDRNDYAKLERPVSWDETAHGFLVFWGRTDDRRPKDKEKWYRGNTLFVIPLDYGSVVKRQAGGDKAQYFGIQDVTLDLDPETCLDCEAEIHLGFFGLRFGLSPVQLADWLLGWFTIDFTGDDRNARYPPERAESRP